MSRGGRAQIVFVSACISGVGREPVATVCTALVRAVCAIIALRTKVSAPHTSKMYVSAFIGRFSAEAEDNARGKTLPADYVYVMKLWRPDRGKNPSFFCPELWCALPTTPRLKARDPARAIATASFVLWSVSMSASQREVKLYMVFQMMNNSRQMGLGGG